MENALKLYSYWRSSAAYRVRIVLHLKGLAFDTHPVHLVADGGQQHTAEFAELNPQQLVPVLMHGRRVIRQSTAIMEYLEGCFPEPAILPVDERERARARSLAAAVACDIHPLANLRVLQYLEQQLGVDEAKRGDWVRHWIRLGFDAIEELLAKHPDTGEFCQGDSPGLADACLVPQVYNAIRWQLPLDAYPTIRRIHDACIARDAFKAAAPEAQPDAPSQ